MHPGPRGRRSGPLGPDKLCPPNTLGDVPVANGATDWRGAGGVLPDLHRATTSDPLQHCPIQEGPWGLSRWASSTPCWSPDNAAAMAVSKRRW